jgi:hypothetical protein
MDALTVGGIRTLHEQHHAKRYRDILRVAIKRSFL